MPFLRSTKSFRYETKPQIKQRNIKNKKLFKLKDKYLRKQDARYFNLYHTIILFIVNNNIISPPSASSRWVYKFSSITGINGR